MMVATFNSNPSTTIISCNSLTNAQDEMDHIIFYNKQSSLVHSISKHNFLIIGGDMNAQIGNDKNNKYCLHNLSKRNEEPLTEFPLENRLTCLNTKSQKRERKLWAFTNSNSTKAQVDYILINKKWINSDLNCKAYSSFEGVSSNHRIFTVKIHLNISRNTTQTAKTTVYDWSSINNRDICNKCTITVRNKFDTLRIPRVLLVPLD